MALFVYSYLFSIVYVTKNKIQTVSYIKQTDEFCHSLQESYQNNTKLTYQEAIKDYEVIFTDRKDWLIENNFKKTRGNFACFCNIEIPSWSDIIKYNKDDDHSDDIPDSLRQGCEWYK